MEINQQPNPLIAQSQVGQQLRFVNWQDSLRGLQFHYDLVFDQKVNPVPPGLP
jgi:hypothetical protein